VLETVGYHMVKTRSLYLTWAWIGTASWQTDGPTDGRTDGQTDKIPIANTRSAVPAGTAALCSTCGYCCRA